MEHIETIIENTMEQIEIIEEKAEVIEVYKDESTSKWSVFSDYGFLGSVDDSEDLLIDIFTLANSKMVLANGVLLEFIDADGEVFRSEEIFTKA